MDLMDSCVEAQHSDAASCYCGGIAWLRGARGEWVVSNVSSWDFMCSVFCCVPVKIEKLDCLYSKTILHVDVHVWTWETISFFIPFITFSRCFKEFVIRPGSLSIGRLRFWMPSFSGLSSPPDWWLLELWCDDLCDDLRRVAIYHQETLGLHVLYDRNAVEHKRSCIPALNYQKKTMQRGDFCTSFAMESRAERKTCSQSWLWKRVSPVQLPNLSQKHSWPWRVAPFVELKNRPRTHHSRSDITLHFRFGTPTKWKQRKRLDTYGRSKDLVPERHKEARQRIWSDFWGRYNVSVYMLYNYTV